MEQLRTACGDLLVVNPSGIRPVLWLYVYAGEFDAAVASCPLSPAEAAWLRDRLDAWLTIRDAGEGG